MHGIRNILKPIHAMQSSLDNNVECFFFRFTKKMQLVVVVVTVDCCLKMKISGAM